MELSEVKFHIFRALSQLIVQDQHLLQQDINEPAISHRLAMHLTPQFKDYDVDCEYNGNVDSENGRKVLCFLSKRADDLGLKSYKCVDGDIVHRCVFPDIIVHKRGLNGPENNLLIIEVKKSSNSDSGAWDEEKLSRFTSQKYGNSFGYKYGVFLRLGVNELFGEVKVCWYVNGNKM